MIELDDLLKQRESKHQGGTHTISLDQQTRDILEKSKRALGRSITAEIIRRAIRAGCKQALATVGHRSEGC